jgi:hypothetical protein
MYIPSLSFSALLLTTSLLSSDAFTPQLQSSSRITKHNAEQINNNIYNNNYNTHAVIKSLPLFSRTSSSSTKLQSASTEASIDETSTSKPKTKKLTLLTFDLDDTLYPINTILGEANEAFARIMKNYGFDGIEPSQIVNTGRKIREEMAITDPEKSACLTHTEIRRLAIREEMEKIVYQRKLEACAEDWATQVSSLSPLVVQNAKT